MLLMRRFWRGEVYASPVILREVAEFIMTRSGGGENCLRFFSRKLFFSFLYFIFNLFFQSVLAKFLPLLMYQGGSILVNQL